MTALILAPQDLEMVSRLMRRLEGLHDPFTAQELARLDLVLFALSYPEEER